MQLALQGPYCADKVTIYIPIRRNKDCGNKTARVSELFLLFLPLGTVPAYDLSSCREVRSVSLGLLASSVVKLRSLSLLLDKTRSSEAPLDFCLTAFFFGLEAPLVIVVWLVERGRTCLREELLPVW